MNIIQYELADKNIRKLISGDEPHYLATTSTILTYNSFHLEKYFLGEPDPKLSWPKNKHESNLLERPGVATQRWHATYGNDGHYYPKHEIGVSILSLPGFAISGISGVLITFSLFYGILGIVIYKLSSFLVPKNYPFLLLLLEQPLQSY